MVSYIANGIAEANIWFAVNFMFKANATIENLGNVEESGHGVKIFHQAPVVDSDIGHRILC